MKFLIAIHHPENYDFTQEDKAMTQDIDELNDEMVAAGVRVFVGGLQPPTTARSLRASADGEIQVTRELYLGSKEYVGGFWVLEVSNEEEALSWGRKAARACRAPVEVRPFH